MKRPEDGILLRDIVDHARRAIAAVAGRERGDLDVDDVWTVVSFDLPAQALKNIREAIETSLDDEGTVPESEITFIGVRDLEIAG